MIWRDQIAPGQERDTGGSGESLQCFFDLERTVVHKDNGTPLFAVYGCQVKIWNSL